MAVTGCEVPDARSASVAEPAPEMTRLWYGPRSWEYADAYRTSAEETAGRVRGVVVFVHGGAWMAGGTEWSAIPPAIGAVREDGWDVVSVSHRLGAGAFIDGMIQDVQSAVSSVRADPRYNGVPVVLAGHSAGGFLAFHSHVRGAGSDGVIVVGAPLEMSQLSRTAAQLYGVALSELARRAIGCRHACSSEVLARYALPLRVPGKVYLAYGGQDEVISARWSAEWGRVLEARMGSERVWVDFVERDGHAVERLNGEYVKLFLESLR
jgi:acetyl esterase/lipase